MEEKGLFSVNEFAKFARTTRDALLHYDKIGLLSPVTRGPNNYRFYSGRQLAVVNLIRTLQQLGMSLEEIKERRDRRTPELAEEVFTRQIEIIDARMNELARARRLLHSLQDSARSVENINELSLEIVYLPAEAIVLGSQNDYGDGRDAYDALLRFYQEISEKYPGTDLNYPVWGFFSGERIMKRDWKWPDRYYFYNPEGDCVRPASYYAVGYARGGYGQSGNFIYPRLLEFINRNGYEVHGDAYEEYPLNEIHILDDTNYLMRVMIEVKKI